MASSAWPPAALATLHDAARCLALAERDALVALPGGGLHRASWRLLHSHVAADPLTYRPRAEADLPVLSWLFRSLGVGGLMGVVGNRVRLATTAYDWLALPAGDQLLALRQIWRQAPEVAWHWLPAHQRDPAHAHAWQALTGQLLATVAALPAETWVLTADLVADLAAQRGSLGVGVARNLPNVRQALNRQADRLVTHLLVEVLPRLGVLATTGEGDHRCLALTPEGAGWLRGEPGPAEVGPGPAATSHAAAKPEPAAAEPPCWQVADDLRLTVPLEAPAAATFEALRFADLVTAGPPAEYRITDASLARGLSHGYELADIRFLLAHSAGRPLSAAATAQLDRWQEALTVVRVEPGYRLRPVAANVLTTLRGREPFRAATELAASGRWAFVSQAESAALMRYLRRAGYVLTPVAPAAGSADMPPALAPLLHRRLPLTSLAVLVGVYSRLRPRVPGLADLGLADLEQTLLAALSPQQRAAVARLVASNAALIARSVDPAADDLAPAAPSAAPPVETAGPGLPESARIAEAVTAAIAAGATLEILYADTGAAVTQRRIRPLRLEERWGRQYVVAYCMLRGDERSFRLDRIVEIL